MASHTYYIHDPFFQPFTGWFFFFLQIQDLWMSSFIPERWNWWFHWCTSIKYMQLFSWPSPKWLHTWENWFHSAHPLAFFLCVHFVTWGLINWTNNTKILSCQYQSALGCFLHNTWASDLPFPELQWGLWQFDRPCRWRRSLHRTGIP